MNNKTTNSKPNDFVWIWTIFATAMGAGVLYLPVNAGINGFWPFIVVALITLPMIYIGHKNLSTVVLAASENSTNINDIVYENFSPKFCNFFAVCYFLAIYPLILIYSVGLTNTASSFISNVLGYSVLPRPVLAFGILLIFFIIISAKPALIRKITESLALPLAGSLFLLSVYLIPNWDVNNLQYTPSYLDFFETLWLTLPVVIFSFNFSPIVSTFTLNYLNHHNNPEPECNKVLWRSCIVLFVFIMFFVLSCILSVNPDKMAEAKNLNMNILIYMGNELGDPILHIVSPIIAIIAMSGAFLGTFFGAKESVIGIIEQTTNVHKISAEKMAKNLNFIAIALILIPSFIFCILDTNILNLISILCGPIIALILFVFPVYAIYKIPKLSKYKESRKNIISNYFVLIVGLISCSAILYSFKYLFNFLK